MTLINVLVVLTKPNRTYFAGETIHGHVKINSTEPLYLTERIYILFYGAAETNLLGRTVKNERSAVVSTNTRNSVSNETYLFAKIFLTPEDSSQVELPADCWNGFPFEFELPTNLPTSYMGLHGYVQYRAVTSIRIRYHKQNYSHNMAFQVINCQDLNLSPIAGRNSYFSFEKLVSIRPDRSQRESYGIINSVVKLPCQGFTPGEQINLEIQLNNQTGLAFEIVYVELSREVQFTCPAGSLSDTDSILVTWRDDQRTTDIHRNLIAQLLIPFNALPTSSQGTSLISIQYFVNINVKLETARSVVTVGKIPVILGTVPLRQIEGIPTATSSRTGSTRSTTSRARARARSPAELEGAVGGDIYAPSAPAVADSSDSEFDENELPPSYSEAINMAPACSSPS